ncbi:archaellin/type IV pilin N-terminal domain-containing protein [Nanoarchaeota archaeon]
MNKKGISPIIAAVILVVVTVTLGTVIYAIVGGYITSGKQDIKEQAEEIRCGRDVGIELRPLNNTYICNSTGDDDDESAFNFIITNTGTRKIDQVQLRVFFDKKIWTNVSILNESLDLGQSLHVNRSYEFDYEDYGSFKGAQVVPRISIPGIKGFAYCIDSAWEVEAMNPC